MTQTTGGTVGDAAELEQKQILKKYLQETREALVWKLEGLTEKQARWPLVPSGNNLLGIVKHCANIEIGYLGECFGRPWPNQAELVSQEDWEKDPQADWYATADESVASVVDLYRRAWAFCDETVETLPLGTVGRVPWWKNGEVTLFRIIVHVTDEIARHAGHADILRELTDRSVGLTEGNTNIPDWQAGEADAYYEKLKSLAERAGN
ncbi:DinB family protein [Promicromonospora sp. NPDC050262]|uniref:DinB family protein n=1 Tax=Promicromonospora sp. NPDC050262 TaxID=3155036 RepID=UPI0033C3160F